MSFKAFRSEQFSHTHENVIFDKLYDALNTAWKDKDDPLYLFGNFCVANAELDALILKRNAIIVIDFKDYGGKIKFSENNIWYADDTPIKGGNQRNPFLQIRTNKYTLLSELKKLAFKSSPNFGHISGLCFFHNPIEFDDSQLPVNISRWFYLTDLQNSLKMINAIVSPEIRFTNSDLETLINFFDVQEYVPDTPKENPAEIHADITHEMLAQQIKNPDHFQNSYTASSELTDTFEYSAVENWLNDDKISVLSVSGSDYSFKNKFLTDFYDRYSPLKEIRILSPNRHISQKYLGDKISSENIHQWLYDLENNTLENEKTTYPIKPLNPNEHIDIIVILDAQLLSNEYTEKDNKRLGSGYLLDDFISLFQPKTNELSLLAAAHMPKILLLGDKYQHLRGNNENNFLLCKCFKKFHLQYDFYELPDTVEYADNTEKAAFQKQLIEQIKKDTFINLPFLHAAETDESRIIHINFNEHAKQIVSDLCAWPKQSIYLCSTHNQVNSVNAFIRNEFLNLKEKEISELLQPKDIIITKNNFFSNVTNNTDRESENGSKIFSYEFAQVVERKPKGFFTKKVTLNGRKEPLLLKFDQVRIQLENGTCHDIVYSVDFLNAEKPELPSTDYYLCINYLAKVHQKNGRTLSSNVEMPLVNPENPTKLSNKNPLLNVAFVRYGYAATIFNAQKIMPFENAFLDASKSYNTDNPATQSYFRMLYTASCSFLNTLKIVNYQFYDYTDFSNAEWNFQDIQLGAVQHKKRYYIAEQNLNAVSAEIPLSNQDPHLVKLYQSIFQQLAHTEWKIVSAEQHDWNERYNFEKANAKIQIDFSYNKKYEFSMKDTKIVLGVQKDLDELLNLLKTEFIINDTLIKNAAECFKTFLYKHKIELIDANEHQYQAVVIIRYADSIAELELTVPAKISKKGIISKIKVRKSSSQEIVDYLKTISLNNNPDNYI